MDWATEGTEHLHFDADDQARHELAERLAEGLDADGIIQSAQAQGPLGGLVADVVDLADEGYDFSASREDGSAGAAQRLVRELGYSACPTPDPGADVVEVGEVMAADTTGRATDVAVALYALGYRSPNER